MGGVFTAMSWPVEIFPKGEQKGQYQSGGPMAVSIFKYLHCQCIQEVSRPGKSFLCQGANLVVVPANQDSRGDG